VTKFSRLLATALLILLVFVASRALIHWLPGDPLDTLLAETGTHLSRDFLRHELKLDQPFLTATWHQLLDALHGDWGISILTKKPIAPVLLERSLRTLLLALVTLPTALSIALLLSFFSIFQFDRPWGARFRDQIDALCTFHTAMAAALPTPWLAPILAYLLAVQFQLFPLGHHLALPVITLCIPYSGLWARLIRERIRETLSQSSDAGSSGAAQAARARGLSEWKVILKYGLAPASGSLLAYLGTQFGALLTGAFVAEVVFDWRGLGSLLIDAVLKRDYPVVEGAVFVTGSFAILGTVLGDWLQWRVDPRVRDLR
jgi:ABC-type dipeptide/oligopeptide/nickel transport system permease component